MNINEIIAAWVRAARTTAELSGEALGTRLENELGIKRGNSKGNISHWETGKHQPSLQQLMAISKITGVPLPNEIGTVSKEPTFSELSGPEAQLVMIYRYLTPENRENLVAIAHRMKEIRK